MAAKTSWHRYGTKLRHCRLMYAYSAFEVTTLWRYTNLFIIIIIIFLLLLLLLLLLQYQHKFTHVSNEPTSVITTLNFRLLNRQYIASPTREDQATATGNMHEHLERGSGDMLAHRRTNRRVHHNTPLPTDCVMTIGCIASYA